MQWARNMGQKLQGYMPSGNGGTSGPDDTNGGSNSPRGPPSALDSRGPRHRSIGTLVQQATSELLIGPDWGQNMELVDTINRGVPGSGSPQEQALKYLKKPLTSSNTHQQLLALTVLETCMKNCGHSFHMKMAYCDIWAAVQMISKKGPAKDVEVYNKCLEMVEDWAHGLSANFPQFRDFYQDLKAKGTTFPPHSIATPADFVAAPPPAPRAAASAGGGRSVIPQALPAGVSEEDRIAIQAAMAEFAAEDQSQAAGGDAGAGGYQPPAFVADSAASLGLGLGALGQAPDIPGPPSSQQQQRQQRLRPTGAPYSGPGLSPDQPVPKLLEDLESAKGMVGLFDEMVSAVPSSSPADVIQEHIKEMAEQVIGVRPRLHQVAESATDEAVLVATLALGEQLEGVLLKHDQLVASAAAAASAPGGAHPAASAAAVPIAAIPPPPAATAGGGDFINLMDDPTPPAAAQPGVAAASSDPFLPVSESVPPSASGDDLAANFDQMVVLQGGEQKPAVGAEAADFDALTMPMEGMRSGPSNVVGAASEAAAVADDPKGKAVATEPEDPFA